MSSPADSASTERGPPSRVSPHFKSTPAPAATTSVWAKRTLAQSQTTTAVAVERIDSGVVKALIPDDVYVDSQPLWTECVAGYFIDEPPSLAKLHATVNRLWRTKKQTAFLDVKFLNPTTAIIRIPSQQSRDWVLEKRVWHIGTTPMIVKQWSPTNAKAPLDMTQIPVWVDFTSVPDSLYSEKGLKFLGDIVGKYQKLHTSTEKCLNFEVARVLAIVNFETELIKTILLTEGEDTVTISVSYPWVPRKCETCAIWGHDLKTCPANSRKSSEDAQAQKDPVKTNAPAPESDKEQTMASGHVSPGHARTEQTKAPTQNMLMETVVEENGSEWLFPKGRKSPRKTTPENTTNPMDTVSPNTFSVLQENDTEDGEFVVQETNDTNDIPKNQNSETELDEKTEHKDKDEISKQNSSDDEPEVQTQMNLQHNQRADNIRGGRGGRGRGRPRKDTSSQPGYATTTTQTKANKASFGKH